MKTCLHCKAPADVTLHSAGPSWPPGLLLDLCADHAALSLARGEATIREGDASGVPVVQLRPSIGAFYGAAVGFLFVAGAFLLLWKMFA